MKIMCSCPVCSQEGISTNNAATIIGSLSEAELRDDGKYDVTCSRGHKSITLLQQHKFEVLYEMGANAILDGYYVEAITAFKASLERFYEFFIRVALSESETPQAVIEESWSSVRKYSERQLGGFVFLYTQKFREKPKVLHTDWDKFRNDVIHSGKIPSRTEAIDFGQAVLDVIRPLIKKTNEAFNAAIWSVVFEDLRSKNGQGKDAVPQAITGQAMILTQTPEQDGRDERTLLNALDELQKQRGLMSSIAEARSLFPQGKTPGAAD